MAGIENEALYPALKELTNAELVALLAKYQLATEQLRTDDKDFIEAIREELRTRK